MGAADAADERHRHRRLGRLGPRRPDAGRDRDRPLRRNCRRLVWLNPLAGTPGYEPLAGGMRAAFPYIDDFLPAGTVASLERLGEILAGIRTSDLTRGGEAAASADAGARAGATIRDLPLTPLWAGRVAPDVARPLGAGPAGSGGTTR